MPQENHYCSECGIRMDGMSGEVCELCAIPENEVSWKKITPWLFPTFNESTLFVMVVSSLLVLFFNEPARRLVTFGSADLKSPFTYLHGLFLFLWFFGGLILALLNAFVARQKSKFEKRLIISFAMMTSLVSSLLCTGHFLRISHGPWVIFPAINLFNVIIITLLFWTKAINEDNISDEDAAASDLILSGGITLTTFVILQFVLKREWYLTYSICVFYGTNLNTPILEARDFLRHLFVKG